MSGKKGHCQTCDYIRSHRGGNRVNEDLVNGISIAAIMQRTGLGRGTLTRHRDEGHMMAGYLPRAHLTTGAKEQLDLMRCAKEIYDRSIKAMDMALGDIPTPATANLSVVGACASPAVKMMEVLAKVSPNDNNETESDGYIDAVRANANNDWKEARDVQMASTKPETEDGSELVDD